MSHDEFIAECIDDIVELTEGVIRIEEEPDPELVDELFRIAHSLKSKLAMEGYDEASEVAHAVEDILETVRGGDVAPPTEEATDHTLKALDGIERLVTDEDDAYPEEDVAFLQDYIETHDVAVAEDSSAESGDESTAATESETNSETKSETEQETGPGTDPAESTGEDATDLTAADPFSMGEVDEASFDDVDEEYEELAADDPLLEAAEGGDGDDLTADEEPLAEPDEDGDDDVLTADEALAAVEEFDDLDALVEDMDDAEEFADLEGGGSFEEADIDTSPLQPMGNEDDSEEESTSDVITPEPKEVSYEEKGGFQPEFNELTEEVGDEDPDVDALDEELEEMEFGEFDDEDVVTINELVEGVEPEEPSPGEADPAVAKAPPAADDPSEADEPSAAEEPGEAPETAVVDDPTEADESPAADEPAGVEEPAAVDEPPKVDEPAAADEPAEVEEPPATDQPAEVEEAAAAEEPAEAEEPPASDEPAEVEEPPDEEEPAEAEEPPATEVDEPPAVNEPDEVEEPPTADEPAEVEEPAAADGPAEVEAQPAASEPAEVEEPPVEEDPAEAEEPLAGEEPAEVDEPPTADEPEEVDEPPTADEPVEVEEQPAASEPAEVEEQPAASEPAEVEEQPAVSEPAQVEEPPAEEEPAEAEEPPAGEGPAEVEEPPTADEPPEPETAESPVSDLETGEIDEEVLDQSMEEFSADTEVYLSRTDAHIEADSDVEFTSSQRETEQIESRYSDVFRETEETEVVTHTTLAESPIGIQMNLSGSDSDARSEQLSIDADKTDLLLSLSERVTSHYHTLSQDIEPGEMPSTVHTSVNDLAVIAEELRNIAVSVRMTPIGDAFAGLRRTARTAAQDTDKSVSLSVSGEAVTLDRVLVNALEDPLRHLVRNAVSHGIEPPDERAAKDKSETGEIRVRAERDGSQVRVQVSDDGYGIDVDTVVEKAIENDLVTSEQTKHMSTGEIYDLLFQPGFSTVESINEVSGRGVGLDSVKQFVDEFNGSVSIESSLDEGTTFELTLPATNAVSQILFVSVGDEQYAIPTNDVASIESLRDTTRLNRAAKSSEAQPTTDGGTQGGIDLRDRFDVPSGEASGIRDERFAIDVVRGDGEVTILVDDVGEREEVVVQSFDDLLEGVPGVRGVTVVEGDRLVPVIEVDTL